MTRFVNTTTPFLRILLSTGEYIQFQAGSLEVAEDDPFHGEVLAEAVRNPSISVMVNETTCRFCGEVLTGDRAAKKLDEHTKQMHFELWQKQQDIEIATVRQREVKARAGYACDVCSPVQTFGSEDDLAAHVNLFHANAPDLDEAGNIRGGDPDEGRRPGEVAPPPAATRK
jgi:hypothetical protein